MFQVVRNVLYRIFKILVVCPPDTLYLRPSIVSEQRGLRGLEEPRVEHRLAARARLLLRQDGHGGHLLERRELVSRAHLRAGSSTAGRLWRA